MKPIKIKETDTRVRAQNLKNNLQVYDNCDVCGKVCNEKRYCCGDGEGIHFDVCSKRCADMGIFQRI